MRTWQLVAAVASKASVPKMTAELAVKGVFEEIAVALERGEIVSIAGFGSFAARDRAERVGRNPRTGEAMVIGACRVPAFKPSRALRAVVSV